MDVRGLIGAGPRGVEIRSVACELHGVRPGTLFFCEGGWRSPLAREAVRLGAVALVVRRRTRLRVPEVAVRDVDAALATAAARLNRHPSRELTVVGVTGTNGKATTTFLIRSMLEAAGMPCGVIGGVRLVIGGDARESHYTTPGAIYIQRYLRRMADAGDRACAMEVSSHGIDQRRVAGTRFAAAVFTNLSREHLDYHKTMERYFAAKRRLFVELVPGVSLVNADDAYGRRLAAEVDGALTFSLVGGADYVAAAVRSTSDGTDFTLVGRGRELRLRTRLHGRFNVSNALAAAATAAALDIDDAAIAGGLARATAPPGRFERIAAGAPCDVIADCADSTTTLACALDAARDLARGRLICVVGGGPPDADRPAMGALVRDRADVGIVTSNSPRPRGRPEDADSVVAEVAAGAGPRAERIVDRPRAIRRALALARRGDVILIAGSGERDAEVVRRLVGEARRAGGQAAAASASLAAAAAQRAREA
jgi:UDP-N-acetylmuramoyl-L-alanyl-D-glutamate--2,6-diaminopimelate ligase